MRILILCTGNSCRSQMAEALLQSFDERLQVFSAGSKPAERVHPMAVRVMAEVGLDISGRRPKSVEEFLNQPFDYVITVCGNARDACPVFVGEVGERLHIGFEDPADAAGSEEEVLEVFRRCRAEIRQDFLELYLYQLAAPERRGGVASRQARPDAAAMRARPRPSARCRQPTAPCLGGFETSSNACLEGWVGYKPSSRETWL